MSYVDAILHIASVPDLVAWFAATDPSMLDASGVSITGFPRTPTVTMGDAALAYVRVTEAEKAAFEATAPGVTVLAERPYIGPETPDEVYGDLFSDAASVALYDAVYDRSPIVVDDGQGGTVSYIRPDRFGQMG